MTRVPGVASDPYRGKIRIPDLASTEARTGAQRHDIPEAVLRRLVDAQRRGAANRELLGPDVDR